MTRRERMERRLERRKEWAEKRRNDSDAAYNRATEIAHRRPFGQPILVGHHSERSARADQNKIDSAMRRSCESIAMADHHEQKADGIERQLKTTIFSDDPDALEMLDAKIFAIENAVARCKAINREIKKGLGWEGRIIPPLTDQERIALLNHAKFSYGEFRGFPAYHTTNLRANARRLKERINNISQQEKRQMEAETAGGILIHEDGEWVSITFAEKPDCSILNDLKAVGFRWGGGKWVGKKDQMPSSLQRTETKDGIM